MLDMDSGHHIGQPATRIDGPQKVTGRALFASDESVPGPAWAVFVTSTIARGRITGIDAADTLAVPGVLDVLWHGNVGGEAKTPQQASGGATTTTLETDQVWHDGQIVAVVLAGSYEAAREGAHRCRVLYEAQEPAATFDSPGAVEELREDGEHEDYDIGNTSAALGIAPVTVDARYGTPIQHHNPIELFTTTCAWSGPKLTVWEPSQFVYGLRGTVAKQLGIDPDDVRVVSRFVGGAFGSKGGATARTAWIAVAARRLGRPVKLVATRGQGYTIASYRAETRHHLRLGAEKDGRLVALDHHGWEVTSRPSHYNVSGTESTARVYACPNIRTRVSIVHADRNTPGFMRAPPDTPYMFPLECAMDELALKLGLDPVELRRRNQPTQDPVTGLPFSSRHMVECLDQGAARFGWETRNPEPGQMRDGDWMIGTGMAAASYPSNISSAAARVTLRPEGHVRVRIAGHEIGNGAYTAIAVVAADRLGLPLHRITVQMGDTEFPPAALAAGSSHTASISHAVSKACEDLRDQLARAATLSNAGPLAGHDPAGLRLRDGRLVAPDGTGEELGEAVKRLTAGAMEAYAESVPEGSQPDAMAKLYGGQNPMVRGQKRKDVTAFAYGAHFVEVRIHRRTCEIRVPRMVGAFACGTIVNPMAARSQLIGGMIWGLSSALLEATEIDKRTAHYVNNNLSEYLIPVNADVGEVDVVMVPETDDRVNPMGIKGLGEIGIVGVNAAIANAVHHATGRRIRTLPIRLEDLLAESR